MKKFILLGSLIFTLTFTSGIAAAQELYYKGEKVIGDAQCGNMYVRIIERFPTEKIVFTGYGFEKSTYIAGAKAVSFNGEHIAVAASSGTYVMDMNMNIVTGIRGVGNVVSVGDFIAVGNKNSVKIFSKEGASMVCQHEFGNEFKVTGLNTLGQFVDVELERIQPKVGEIHNENMRFLITEERLVKVEK